MRRRWIAAGVLVVALSVGLFALAVFGPVSGKDHLYHDESAGVVPAADAHWPNKKWCRHHNGWFFDHHMHYMSQFWKGSGSNLRHYHKERYHHWGTPNDHDRRNTRCPLHR